MEMQKLSTVPYASYAAASRASWLGTLVLSPMSRCVPQREVCRLTQSAGSASQRWHMQCVCARWQFMWCVGSALRLRSLNAGEMVTPRHSVCPLGLHNARARHTRLFAVVHVRSGVLSPHSGRCVLSRWKHMQAAQAGILPAWCCAPSHAQHPSIDLGAYLTAMPAKARLVQCADKRHPQAMQIKKSGVEGYQNPSCSRCSAK
jgi:hypothetical protein